MPDGKVIEAALMMIAETSEAKAQAKIARLEANHQKQLTNLKRQMEKNNSSHQLFQPNSRVVGADLHESKSKLSPIANNGCQRREPQSAGRFVGKKDRRVNSIGSASNDSEPFVW